ncbi:MAG: hypothetical protein GY725_02440 [bacterium]|nr:hypothetical protein [bacterium]
MRPLLVSKKCFMTTCAKAIQKYLREFGHEDIEVISENWSQVDLTRPNVIPLINYGMIGTNRFEHFNCAYCLNSYYVTEREVNQILQDVLGADVQIALEI